MLIYLLIFMGVLLPLFFILVIRWEIESAQNVRKKKRRKEANTVVARRQGDLQKYRHRKTGRIYTRRYLENEGLDLEDLLDLYELLDDSEYDEEEEIFDTSEEPNELEESSASSYISDQHNQVQDEVQETVREELVEDVPSFRGSVDLSHISQDSPRDPSPSYSSSFQDDTPSYSSSSSDYSSSSSDYSSSSSSFSSSSDYSFSSSSFGDDDDY